MSVPMRNGVPGQIRHVTRTLTASGRISNRSGTVILSNASAVIAATLQAPRPGEELLITNQSASGTQAHTVTLPVGVTFDGTNRRATLDAPGETILIRALSRTRFLVLVNIGAVAFSNP